MIELTLSEFQKWANQLMDWRLKSKLIQILIDWIQATCWLRIAENNFQMCTAIILSCEIIIFELFMHYFITGRNLRGRHGHCLLRCVCQLPDGRRNQGPRRSQLNRDATFCIQMSRNLSSQKKCAKKTCFSFFFFATLQILFFRFFSKKNL